MTNDRPIENWLVKDVDGEIVTVKANDWECGGNGLMFYLGKEKVAHFVRWASYWKQSAPPSGVVTGASSGTTGEVSKL